MDPTLTTLYLCIFIASAAVVYDQLTKRIPSRLRAEEAPQSGFGLVRADQLSSHKHARADGIEQVHTSQRLCRPTNWSLVSSSSTASARTLTQRGAQKTATGLITSSRKTSPRRSTKTFESTSTTTIRTGRGMPCRHGYQVSGGACSIV